MVTSSSFRVLPGMVGIRHRGKLTEAGLVMAGGRLQWVGDLDLIARIREDLALGLFRWVGWEWDQELEQVHGLVAADGELEAVVRRQPLEPQSDPGVEY